MGLLERIKRALDKKKIAPEDKSEVMELKKKIWPEDKREPAGMKKKIAKQLLQLHKEASKQGKRVESLTVIQDTRAPSRSVFEFVLSDGTPDKLDPYKKTRKTLVGRSYDYYEKSMWVEEYKPGVQVFLVVCIDGSIDILKLTWSDGLSKPKRVIWWIENKEKVCKRFHVTATPPPDAPLISFGTSNLKTTLK